MSNLEDGTICKVCNCEVHRGECNCDYYRRHPEAVLPADDETRALTELVRKTFEEFAPADGGGVLEIGCNDNHEVVINHPDLKPDKNGVGHIVFSPRQARSLARTLMQKANEAEGA